MGSTEMSRSDRQLALETLKRLYDSARREYEQKAIKYDELGKELMGISESLRSYKGSIASVERELGLSEQIDLPDAPEVRIGKQKSMDASEATMRIVAAKNENITFDEILQTLIAQGYKITREYMHTVLNRKKNYQKKLDKKNGKWFLTEKGKQELGIE
jgi:hypothetical protein